MNIIVEVDVWRDYIEKFNTCIDKKGRDYEKLIEAKEVRNNATVFENFAEVLSHHVDFHHMSRMKSSITEH